MKRPPPGSGRRLRALTALAPALTATAALAAPPARAHTQTSGPALTTITLDTLPIANALPLDLGIKKGFFEAQGIQIDKKILQSGNDIVLALANNSATIGYVGWVPAMIARVQGIPLVAVAPSEVE